eukprot:SAG31_NODE_17409_length_671_cov_1.980769_2_plen_168_part_00
MPLVANLKPIPTEVTLRLSPPRPSRRQDDQDRSFSRMYQGRPSIGPVRSDSAIFLERDFSEDTTLLFGEEDEPMSRYDPKEPWASPRGERKSRKTTPPKHNFLPGLTQIANRVRQRSVYTGDFYMSRRTQCKLDQNLCARWTACLCDVLNYATIRLLRAPPKQDATK